MLFLHSFHFHQCFRAPIAPVARLWFYGRQSSVLSHCVNEVKIGDYENYLCTLLHRDESAKSALFVVLAFNVELARVLANVGLTNQSIVKMRLQFWRDAVASIFAKRDPANSNVKRPIIPRQPVTQALKMMIIDKDLNIPEKFLYQMIDARDFASNGLSFETLNSSQLFAVQTIGSVLSIGVHLYDGAENESNFAAVKFVAKSLGFVNMLRSMPLHARQGRVLLPDDVLKPFGVSRTDVYKGRFNSPNVKEMVKHIAQHATTNLTEARKLSSEVSIKIMPVFMMTVVIDYYLKVLKHQADFDVFHPVMQKRDAFLPVRLLKRRILKSY